VGEDVLGGAARVVAKGADPVGGDAGAAEEGEGFFVGFENVDGTGRAGAEPADELVLAAVEPIGRAAAGEVKTLAGGGDALEERFGPGAGGDDVAGRAIALLKEFQHGDHEDHVAEGAEAEDEGGERLGHGGLDGTIIDNGNAKTRELDSSLRVSE
jgi:hypothetical protein